MTLDPASLFSSFDLTSRKAIVAAVSGGSDSLAMLVLMHRRLSQHAHIKLIAVTVDHGLREESRVEAKAVGSFCAEHGIAHRIKTWTGDKPKTGVPAAGREARYGLLSEAAQGAGTDIIVTGHTADDQAETVAMRKARGDGRGLAGMAPATLFEGQTWIVRPLLGIRRETLRNLLRTERISWIDDPTNEDKHYERPRVRSGVGLDVDAIIAEAADAARRRSGLAVGAAGLVVKYATQPMRGLVKLERVFGEDDEAAAIYALRALLGVIGGVAHLPDEARTAALVSRLRDGNLRATLSRCVIDARKDGVFVYREARGSQKLLPDNLPEMVGVPNSIIRAATVSNVLFARDAGQSLAPWRVFLPGFDLPLAKAIAKLIHAPKIPDAPYRDHNREEP